MFISSSHQVQRHSVGYRSNLNAPKINIIPRNIRLNGPLRINATAAPGNGSVAQPAPVTVNIPEAKPLVLPPPANFQNIVAMGVAKGKAPAGKTFITGVIAGAFIAFGTFLMVGVGGNMPGLQASHPGLWKLLYAFVFPYGLLMTLLNAPELYTGNTAIVGAAYLEGQVTIGQLAKNWFFSYAGNFVGSLIMVALVAASGCLAGNMMPVNAAVAKTTLPLGVALVRGVLANWLVCIAVVSAAAASTLPGKMLGIWFPVVAFVALGLEHSVANMFTVPMGIALGAKTTMVDFVINNLIPVTIGNTIGGVLCVAVVGSLCYGSLGKKFFGA